MDLYAELGLSRDASADEIKAAHRREAKTHHPDRGGDRAKFQAIQLAYDTLKDEPKRKRYDETGETAGSAPPNPIEQMLAFLIDSLISQMVSDPRIPIDTTDMRQICLSAIDDKIAEMSAQRAKASRDLEQAMRLAKRWKRKRRAKGPDLVKMAIDRQRRDLSAAIEKLDEGFKAWQQARKLMESYDYEFDPPAAPQWSGAGPFGGTGGLRFTPQFFEFGGGNG